MATHSSILAWKFRWTEEPGGLQESDTTEHRAHVPHHDLALKNKVGHQAPQKSQIKGSSQAEVGAPEEAAWQRSCGCIDAASPAMTGHALSCLEAEQAFNEQGRSSPRAL